MALSSRNVYLGPDERSQAPVLYRALRVGAAAVEGGGAEPALGVVQMEAVLAEARDLTVDYAALVESDTFAAPERIAAGAEVRLLVVGKLGRARLIGNVGARAP